MKVSAFFVLFTSALLVAVRSQDPLCRNGLIGPFGLAAGCCPRMCGTCGGPGCEARPGGAGNCCGQTIAATGRSCDQFNAPCTIQRDPDCVTGIANRAAGVCCATGCGDTCGGIAGQGCERAFNVPAGEPTTDRCCAAEIRQTKLPCTLSATSCYFDTDPVTVPQPQPVPQPAPQAQPVFVQPPPVFVQPPPVFVQRDTDKCGNQLGQGGTKYNECVAAGHQCDQCIPHFGKRERRSLVEINARQLVETDSECSNENYDMFLVVTGAHFAGLATPKDSNNCPSVVFHAEAFADSHLKKIALQVHQDDVVALKDEHKLHLGTKRLVQIVDAFESAPVSKKGALYDAISNNCVVMLRNMADPLDIPVDERMLGFITKKLTSSASEHIIAMMKGSPTLNTLYEGSRRMLKDISVEDLLAKVIKLYV